MAKKPKADSKPVEGQAAIKKPGVETRVSLAALPIGDIEELATFLAERGVELDTKAIKRLREDEPRIRAAIEEDPAILEALFEAPADTLAKLLGHEDKLPLKKVVLPEGYTYRPGGKTTAQSDAEALFLQLLQWLDQSPQNANSFRADAFSPVRTLGAGGPPQAVADVIEALGFVGLTGTFQKPLPPDLVVHAEFIGHWLRNATEAVPDAGS